jgi:hypothetical protein
MVEPVAAPVQTEAVKALIALLAGLRGDAVVGTIDQETEFGLNDPDVQVSMVSDEGQRVSLMVRERDGSTFAKTDGGASICSVSGSVLTQLRAELRDDSILTFDAKDVVSFSVSKDETTNGFTRSESGWTYDAEPDLPLDTKKVEDLLLRIRDLKTERFVRYQASDSDSAELGFDNPERVISIKFSNDKTARLVISSSQAGPGAPPGRLATRAEDQSSVFVLSNEMLSRTVVSLNELE